MKNLHRNNKPYVPKDKTGYSLLDANLAGLFLEREHGHLRIIQHKDGEVVYSFYDKDITLTAEEVTRMVAEEKPKLLSFLSELYEKPIEDLSVYGSNVSFSGHPDILDVNLRDFRNNELRKYTIREKLGDKYLLFESGIDPYVAEWMLEDEYQNPITVKSVKNGQVIIDSGGKVVISEKMLRDRVNKLKTCLTGLGVRLPMNMAREEIEQNIINGCRTRIEYLVELDDLPYVGFKLLGGASALEHLEALSTIQQYANNKKGFQMNGIYHPEMVVHTLIDRGKIVTGILPADDVFVGISKKLRPRLGKNLLFNGRF